MLKGDLPCFPWHDTSVPLYGFFGATNTNPQIILSVGRSIVLVKLSLIMNCNSVLQNALPSLHLYKEVLMFMPCLKIQKKICSIIQMVMFAGFLFDINPQHAIFHAFHIYCKIRFPSV